MKWGLKFLLEREKEREIKKNTEKKEGRIEGQGWAIWQVIKRRESREDERGETETFGLLLHLFLFCPLVPFIPLTFFCLPLAPSLPLSPHTIKTAWLCCRLELQNKSHLGKESVEMEPAERQEKIPTESQKEKDWERLQGEWKHIGVQNETIAKPGKKLHEERKREREKEFRDQR